MKKSKGFTLIELLAVIVILAIIAVTAVPLITNVIEQVRKSAYEESLRNIFNATELYIATNEFQTFPSEGIEISDLSIKMNNQNFTSGRVIKNDDGKLELEKISNGSYCGSGSVDNLVIIEGSCDSMDNTPPTISINSNFVTSNSVTIVATAEDLESGINGYQFSKDNGTTWTANQTSNVYNFTGLSNSTEYTFKVKVYNNNLLSTESNALVVSTTDMLSPTYGVNVTGWSKSKIVTINYPPREAGYVYEYSLDDAATWVTVASPLTTIDVTFNNNGNIIARISDGINEISAASYDVTNIDNEIPLITVNPSTVTISVGASYNDTGVTATDNSVGDITTDIITTGTVNRSVAGSYTLTYNVSDAAGNAAAPKTRTVIVAQDISGPGYVTSKGVNGPVLATGMTPIKWNGSSWAPTTTTDSDWYDYSTTNKKWANAQTADGSMWVWIPRYIYKITSGWHSASTGTIDIQFSMGTDDTRGGSVTLDTGTTSNASNNKWTNHPAFTFGTTQVTGIWVAKFEPTAAEGVASGSSSCVAADNVTTKTIKVIPGQASWRCLTIGNAFTVSRNMETKSIYGWGTTGSGIDTHMMKNTEWGAITYLSKSIYGANSEVWINPANTYTTGCAGDSATASSTSGCLRTYSTTNGVKSSTTGNIYGIYDTVGGADEQVAAYINYSSAASVYGSNIVSADDKYKDIYMNGDEAPNTYAFTNYKKGDAIYETSNSPEGWGTSAWYNDYFDTPFGNYVWFRRSGMYGMAVDSGHYYFQNTTGTFYEHVTFRPILLVQSGL